MSSVIHLWSSLITDHSNSLTTGSSSSIIYVITANGTKNTEGFLVEGVVLLFYLWIIVTCIATSIMWLIFAMDGLHCLREEEPVKLFFLCMSPLGFFVTTDSFSISELRPI